MSEVIDNLEQAKEYLAFSRSLDRAEWICANAQTSMAFSLVSLVERQDKILETLKNIEYILCGRL